MKDDIKAIRKEFRSSADARYIHRLHGVLLVLNGLSTVEAGKMLGDPQRTVSEWMIQYRKGGLDALRDGEKPGRPGVLDAQKKRSLSAALKKTPQDFGLEGDMWTGLLVSEYLRKELGIELTMRHARRILRTLEGARGA